MTHRFPLAVLIFLSLASIVSCRSQKSVQTESHVAVDSVARSESHRSISSLESHLSSLNLDFDTLSVTIERLLASDSCLPSETVKIKAIGGKITCSKEQRKLAAEDYTRLDTLAYKRACAESHAVHTATTAVYSPPSAVAVVLLALVLLAGLAYVLLRNRL